MLSTFRIWLNQRTGYIQLRDALLLEHIPGGAKWRYVWGSCLAFTFSLQLITGILLMTAYSPGASTAWGSVYFIQYEMEFGWLIRGIHHFGSQAMIILLALHMLQVVIAGAQLPPRELNWWLGLALMACVAGLSLTGYLLPWDQKGYWATQVATSIAGEVPGIGSFIKRILVGGPEYGNHTLSRFYAMHVGVLPLLVIVLLVIHVTLFRRHGVTAPKDAQGVDTFWPAQAFKDLLACLVVFGVLLYFVIFGSHGHVQDLPTVASYSEPTLYERMALAGRDGMGADLGAPADAQGQFPARPEWYFLFLFQLLKYFEGEQILIGTVLIPNAAAILLFLLPLLGYGRMRPFGHVLGVLVVVAGVAAVAALTCLAIAADTPDALSRQILEGMAYVVIPTLAGLLLMQLALLSVLPKNGFRSVVFVMGSLLLGVLTIGALTVSYGIATDTLPDQVRTQFADWEQTAPGDLERTKRATLFREQVSLADESARRAVNLAQTGIPDGGAILVLHPVESGKTLFVQKCGVCHSYKGVLEGEDAKFSASDLFGFASKDWIRGLLRNPDDPHYFGRTPLKERTMSNWVNTTRLAKAEKVKATDADFDLIAAWLGTHPTTRPKEDDPHYKGYEAFEKIQKCIRCHRFDGTGGTSASHGPDFSGYGSPDWIRLMITSPEHPARFGRDNRNVMTMFRDLQGPSAEMTKQDLKRIQDSLLAKLEALDNKSPEYQSEHEKILKSTTVNHLSDTERELIIRFLVGDDEPAFFARPFSPPEAKTK